jgi:FkbM family methyltransferase
MINILDPAWRAMFRRRLANALRRKAGIYYRRSYAQCGEDVIARTLFDILGIAHPSYLDIGAHHPHFLSNTFLFYQDGSRGINVEPDPALYAKIAHARPRDTNLNVGVGKEPGHLDLYIMSSRTLNTLSESEAKTYESQGYKIEDKRRVEVTTIDRIIEQHLGGAPEFLSVDVEGLDYEILASLDFEKYRPLLICVETISFSQTGQGGKRTEIDELLRRRGYMQFADTYINTLYVDREKWTERRFL